MATDYVKLTRKEFDAIRDSLESNDSAAGNWVDEAQAEHRRSMRAIRAAERRNGLAPLGECPGYPESQDEPACEDACQFCGQDLMGSSLKPGLPSDWPTYEMVLAYNVHGTNFPEDSLPDGPPRNLNVDAFRAAVKVGLETMGDND